MKPAKLPNPPATGWPPGMLQDDSRELSRWLASRPGAKHQVDLVCQEIKRSHRKEARRLAMGIYL